MEEGLRTVLELWINVPPSALRLVTTATVNDLLCPLFGQHGLVAVTGSNRSSMCLFGSESRPPCSAWCSYAVFSLPPTEDLTLDYRLIQQARMMVPNPVPDRATYFATTSTGRSIKSIGETAAGFSALKPKLLLLWFICWWWVKCDFIDGENNPANLPG